MYNIDISEAADNQKVFEKGLRIAEAFTLFVKSAFYKKKEEDQALSYFLRVIKKGSTVIDIGAHSDDYLYFLLKIAKQSAKLISFESDPETYNFLSQKKEILKLKNVFIEQLTLSKETEKVPAGFLFQKRNGAAVIDFKTGKNQLDSETVASNLLDKYCEFYDVQPDVLRINAKGNELTILTGATSILEKYKPKIFLECLERYAGKDNILRTFTFLTDLNYTGYFILDTMKIPIVNFDFNIYQNPLSNFYCKDFIFE